ncbi:MAG: monovalent cation/H+ antiporter complex subunit F [Rhodospirillales bacterium]|jgi:multicomponent Na+:H+ antiporter subunit F|nr:monovalent cation/H+ antiporter complex subunit F [Rhodospirillales bacterium]HJO72918.1 monovalent cation/H+ antiporter complex subunit F [Rhodospirillales bacterium]
MFAASSAAVLAVMALTLVRALMGPTVYDRILAVNAFGSLTVLLIAVFGFLTGRPEFLDIALIYALINFIATIAVSKFVEFAFFGDPAGEEDGGDL